MSEFDTNAGEHVGGTDTDTGEQSSTQQDTVTSELDNEKESARVAAREGIVNSALESIGYDNGQYSEKLLSSQPEWVQKEIISRSESDKRESFSKDDFERLYAERRDKEEFADNFSTIVKENYLAEDESKALNAEVEKLVSDHSMTYRQALDYAAKGFNSNSLNKGIKIGSGQVAHHSNVAQDSGFVPMSIDRYTSMPDAARKEYQKKSLELHNEVKFK